MENVIITGKQSGANREKRIDTFVGTEGKRTLFLGHLQQDSLIGELLYKYKYTMLVGNMYSAFLRKSQCSFQIN